MAITRLITLICFLGAFGYSQALAQSPEVQAELDTVSAQLQSADTQDERNTTLRSLQDIAAANPDSNEAQVAAFLGTDRVLREAGPNAILDALIQYAEAGNPLDSDALRNVLVPILANANDLTEIGVFGLEDSAALDARLKKLDEALKAAGMPFSAQSVLEDPFADTPALPSAVKAMRRSIAATRFFARMGDLGDMTPTEIIQWAEDGKGMLPKHVNPSLSGPLNVILFQHLRHTAGMWEASNEGLAIVEDCIKNRRCDEERLARVTEKLRGLSKGPFNKNTLRDMIASSCDAFVSGTADLCKQMLDPLFRAAERSLELQCGKITCDCQSQGGMVGEMRRSVECTIRETLMKSQCLIEGAPRSACLQGASGPNATAWESR